MPLIRLTPGSRSGAFAEDRFFFVADGNAYPDERGTIVTLARFQGERETLFARAKPVGVRLAASENPAVLKADLPQIAAIVLEFPKFRDGRPFSWSRMLRTRFAYQGELRAVGDFLPDQIAFMARVGFDSFEVRQDFTLEQFDHALNAISLVYQPAADGRKPIRDLRAG